MTRRVVAEGGDMRGVWILGGTGRTGRAVAAELARSGIEPVLVGRDPGRLRTAAAAEGWPTRVLAGTGATAAAVVDAAPAVLLSTAGPFTATAPGLVDACLAAGSDYVDLANDLAAVSALLARDADAVRAGRTLVTGAGFGVTATESVVVRLCGGAGPAERVLAERGPAERVRTDMVPSLELRAGRLGEALAGTLVEGLPGVPGGRRFGGRRFAAGQLAPASVGGEVRELVTPDGDRVATGLMPLGELVAARRASGAPFVDAASSEAPSGLAARALLPVGTRLLGVDRLRRLAARRLADVRFSDRPAPREHSWGHALVTWADGTRSEGWLALPEAQAATVAVAAEVVRRLARGEGRPGAFTPAALFGPGLVESVGGRYVLEEEKAS